MIGSHNVGDSEEEVVKGILSVVEKTKSKQPRASLIVMVSTVFQDFVSSVSW